MHRQLLSLLVVLIFTACSSPASFEESLPSLTPQATTVRGLTDGMKLLRQSSSPGLASQAAGTSINWQWDAGITHRESTGTGVTVLSRDKNHQLVGFIKNGRLTQQTYIFKRSSTLMNIKDQLKNTTYRYKLMGKSWIFIDSSVRQFSASPNTSLADAQSDTSSLQQKVCDYDTLHRLANNVATEARFRDIAYDAMIDADGALQRARREFQRAAATSGVLGGSTIAVCAAGGPVACGVALVSFLAHNRIYLYPAEDDIARSLSDANRKVSAYNSAQRSFIRARDAYNNYAREYCS